MEKTKLSLRFQCNPGKRRRVDVNQAGRAGVREWLGGYWPVFMLTPVAALAIAFGTIALSSYKTVTSNPCSRLGED